MKNAGHLAVDNEKESPVAGTVTAVGLVAACVACCLPLITPFLTWLGLSGLATVVAGYWWLGGGIALTGTGWLLLLRRQRRAARQAGACGCPSTAQK